METSKCEKQHQNYNEWDKNCGAQKNVNDIVIIAEVKSLEIVCTHSTCCCLHPLPITDIKESCINGYLQAVKCNTLALALLFMASSPFPPRQYRILWMHGNHGE